MPIAISETSMKCVIERHIFHQLLKTFLSKGGSKETAPESRIAQIDKQAVSIPEQRGGKRESRENRSHR